MPFTSIEMNLFSNEQELENRVAYFAEKKMLPTVWLDGVLVGDYEDVLDAAQNGELYVRATEANINNRITPPFPFSRYINKKVNDGKEFVDNSKKVWNEIFYPE